MKLARTSLSLSLVAAALLLVAPGYATAAPVALGLGFLNSTLTFGGPSFSHSGYDTDILNLYGVSLSDDWDIWETEFEASGGTFAGQTPVTDGSGTLVRTDYHYVGGLFRIGFDLTDGANHLTGSFTAPITTLDIYADEPLDDDDQNGTGSNVIASYALGPGLFDAAFASAFGIPQHTGSGWVDADMLLFIGDHSSPELVAENGATYGDINAPAAVPETPQSVLAGLGVLAVLLVRFSRTSRTIASL